MKKRNGNPFIHRRFAIALGLCLGAAAAPAWAVDISDYFPLTQGSFWHYTGAGQEGSSPDDDFRWEVLADAQVISPGVEAVKIKTITDESDDDRNGDIDFWRVNGTGQLFFCGLTFTRAKGSGIVPAQTIVLSDPLLIGGDGQAIGSVVNDTASATIQTLFGNVNGTINSTITYSEIVPQVTTPLGKFNDVLHLIVEIRGVVGPSQFDVHRNEFYLKEGIGLIKQDQDADPDDAEIQVIDGGRVGATTIVPDIPNAAAQWMLYE